MRRARGRLQPSSTSHVERGKKIDGDHQSQKNLTWIYLGHHIVGDRCLLAVLPTRSLSVSKTWFTFHGGRILGYV